MGITRADITLITPEPYVSLSQPREERGILYAGDTVINIESDWIIDDSFQLFLDGILQTDYEINKDGTAIVLPQAYEVDKKYTILIGTLLRHQSSDEYTSAGSGSGGITKKQLKDIQTGVTNQLNAFKESITDDLDEIKGEVVTTVVWQVSTPPITADKFARGYTKTFTTSANSLASPEQTISKFIVSIPELNIEDKVYFADENGEASIAVTIPDTFLESNVTVKIYAVDAINNRSKINTKVCPVYAGIVEAPSILYPSEGEKISYGKGITVQTTNFKSTADDTHKCSSWKITDDEAGLNILADEMDSSDLTSHKFESYTLDKLTGDHEYYIHALHVGDTLDQSVWSSPRKIKTRNGVSTKNGRFIYRHESDKGIVIEWELNGEPKKLFVYDELVTGLPMLITDTNARYDAVMAEWVSIRHWEQYPSVIKTAIQLYGVGQKDAIPGISTNLQLEGNGDDSKLFGPNSSPHPNSNGYKSSRLLCNFWITLNSSNTPSLVNYARSITDIEGIDNLDIPSIREMQVILTEFNNDNPILSKDRQSSFFDNKVASNYLTSNTYWGDYKWNDGYRADNRMVGFAFNSSNGQVTIPYNNISGFGGHVACHTSDMYLYNRTDLSSFLVRDLTYLSSEQDINNNVIELTSSSQSGEQQTTQETVVSTPNIPIDFVPIGNEISFETFAQNTVSNVKIAYFNLSLLGIEHTFTATNNSAEITFTIPSTYTGENVTLYLYAVDTNGNQSKIASKLVNTIKSVVIPTILEPKENEIVYGNIKIHTDDFTSSTTDVHKYSNWKITTDVEGTNIIYSDMMSSDLITHTFLSKTLKQFGIVQDKDYYLFVQHVGNNLKASAWSYPRKIHIRSSNEGIWTNNGRFIYRHESDKGYIVEWKVGGRKKKLFVYDTVLTGKNFCSSSFNEYNNAVITGTTPFKTIYHNIETRGLQNYTCYDNGCDDQFNNFNIPNSRTMCNWWLNKYYNFPVIEQARATVVEGIGNLDIANSQELQMILTEPLLCPNTTVSYCSCTPTESNNNQLDYFGRAATYYSRGGVAMNGTTGYRFILVRDLDTLEEYDVSDVNEIVNIPNENLNVSIERQTVVTSPSISIDSATLGVAQSFNVSAESTLDTPLAISKFIFTILGTDYEFNATNNEATVTFTIPISYQEFQAISYLYAVDEQGNQSKIISKTLNIHRGQVNAPIILYPSPDDVISYVDGLTVKTNAFSSTTQDTHQYTNWKITTDIEGKQIFYQESYSKDLLSHTFNLQFLLRNNFDSSKDYYVFASHIGTNLKDSEWSVPVKIKPRAGTITENGHFIYRHESDEGYVVEYKINNVLKKMFVHDNLISGIQFCNTTFNYNTNHGNTSTWKAIYYTPNIRGILNVADTYENGADKQFNNFNLNTSRSICNTWLSTNYHLPVIEEARSTYVEGIGDLDIANVQEMQVILSEPILCPNTVGYTYGTCNPTSGNDANICCFNNTSNSYWAYSYAAMNNTSTWNFFMVKDLDGSREMEISDENYQTVSNEIVHTTIPIGERKVSAPVVTTNGDFIINKAVRISFTSSSLLDPPVNISYFYTNIEGSETNPGATKESSYTASYRDYTIPQEYTKDTLTMWIYTVDTQGNQSEMVKVVFPVIYGEIQTPELLLQTTDLNNVQYHKDIILKTSAFKSTINENHDKTAWKITTDKSGLHSVIERCFNELTATTFSFVDLYNKMKGNTTYYAFASHYGRSSRFSKWSYPVQFKTRDDLGLTTNGRFIYRHYSNEGYVVEYRIAGETKYLFVADEQVTGLQFSTSNFNYNSYSCSANQSNISFAVSPRGTDGSRDNIINNGCDEKWNNTWGLPGSKICCDYWLSKHNECPVINYARSKYIQGIGNLDIADLRQMQMLVTEPLFTPELKIYGSCTPSTGNDKYMEMFGPVNNTTIGRTYRTYDNTADVTFIMVKELDNYNPYIEPIDITISDNREETTTVEIAEQESYSYEDEDLVLTNGTVTNNKTPVTAKSIELTDMTVDSGSMQLTADDNVILDNVVTTGTIDKKTSGNAMFSINTNDEILVKDCEFNADSYNGLEIGLTNTAPSRVVISNCRFEGNFSNNAISVFAQSPKMIIIGGAEGASGFQPGPAIPGMDEPSIPSVPSVSEESNNEESESSENSGNNEPAIPEIIISDCYFQSVSNVLRISNRLNTQAIFTLVNCTIDSWDSGQYGGCVLLQDYTSKSVEEADTNNLFSKDKITINFYNCTYNGNKISSSKENCCATGDENQLVYIYRDKGGGILQFEGNEDKYPTINFK